MKLKIANFLQVTLLFICLASESIQGRPSAPEDRKVRFTQIVVNLLNFDLNVDTFLVGCETLKSLVDELCQSVKNLLTAEGRNLSDEFNNVY